MTENFDRSAHATALFVVTAQHIFFHYCRGKDLLAAYDFTDSPLTFTSVSTPEKATSSLALFCLRHF